MGVPDLYPQLDPGLNFLETPPSEDVSDMYGHGTAVASIIAATHDNGSSITGISPGVRIVPLKACYANPLFGDIICPELTVAEALSWAFDQGDIDVVNMSFGGSTENDSIKYFIDLITSSYGGWGIVVGAAGNDGNGQVDFPARYEPVVAVAGVKPDGSRHPLSNYGSDLDFAAPYTTRALTQFGYADVFDGTSAATPFVSALAALYKSEYPTNITDYPFSAVVCAKTTTGGWWNGGSCAWNNQTGRGVPDAWFMLRYGGCHRFDYNGDRVIDVADGQYAAFRLFSFSPQIHYDVRVDVNPFFYPDGFITIADFQRVFQRVGVKCKP